MRKVRLREYMQTDRVTHSARATFFTPEAFQAFNLA